MTDGPRIPAFPSYPPRAELATNGRLTRAALAATRKDWPLAPERSCTPCALERDTRTLATCVMSGPGPRPLEWWSCDTCREIALASGKALRATPIDVWFEKANTKWDADETVAALKGKPCP